MKKIAYFVGVLVLGFIAWRVVKNLFMPVKPPGPRQTLTAAQRMLDDNAPMAVYARIVPPLAQNVTPQAGNIILRRNDSVIPNLYTLAAIGPNGLS